MVSALQVALKLERKRKRVAIRIAGNRFKEYTFNFLAIIQTVKMRSDMVCRYSRIDFMLSIVRSSGCIAVSVVGLVHQGASWDFFGRTLIVREVVKS